MFVPEAYWALTTLRPFYLHNGISYTGKVSPLYWIRAHVFPGHAEHGPTSTPNEQYLQTHQQSKWLALY